MAACASYALFAQPAALLLTEFVAACASDALFAQPAALLLTEFVATCASYALFAQPAALLLTEFVAACASDVALFAQPGRPAPDGVRGGLCERCCFIRTTRPPRS